jgi:hypothetical protein
MNPAPMRLIGNLDCEGTWARLAAKGSRRRPRVLRRSVRVRISAYATLLRVFAHEGDTLWTPLPVDPDCVREVEGLPRPTLESGSIGALPWRPVRMAWGEEDDVAARVNHRSFAHEIASRLGLALAGSRWIRRLDELERAASATPRWVLKAPHAAAGRSRVHGTRGDITDTQRAQAARLMAEHGSVLFEPWMERIGDFGYGSHGPLHVIAADARGRFRGIALPAPKLPLAERLQVDRVRDEVTRALDEAGYEGPWGVDAYRYRLPSGAEHLQPLSEINARLTFGHVAEALVERVARPRWGSAAAVALRFGARPEVPDTKNAIPLLGSADGRTMHAWLERTASE